MMRDTEKELEKKRKNEGGSNGENLRELEKKRNCPFDAKKVCPVTHKANLSLCRFLGRGIFVCIVIYQKL